MSCSSLAGAQADLAGTWRAGATAIDVSIESWGTDCGTRPTSARSSGGGLVTVEQRGQVLVLHGRDQDISTEACWSHNPAMKRSAVSYSDGMWMIRCRTAADDPRAELGIYTLTMQGPETLLYKDVSHYDWALNESKCVATFTTSQTLTRVASARDAVATNKTKTQDETEDEDEDEPSKAQSAASPKQATQAKGCRPGPAATITLRPKEVEIEVGEKVCFKVRVTDASDCALPSANVSWQLQHSDAIRGTLSNGCFTAANTAAEAEGEFRVTAKSGAARSEALVVVKRMDLSALIARRMENTGLTGLDELEAEEDTSPKAVARIATHTAPASLPNSRRGWVVGLGLLAVGLISVGFWMSRRQPKSSRSAPRAQRAKADPTPTPKPAAARPADEAQAWICPTCRVGYPANQTSCPKDGTRLVPYAEFAEHQKREQQAHEKRCPTCGKTYPATAGFCGEDGSSLVDQT